MADENKESDLDKEQSQVEESAKNITPEERAELEELRKYKDLSARDLAGKNTKITELSKEVKARMTEEERIKSESQSVLNDLLEEFKGIASGSLGLDDKHKALIKGSNKDEIKESADLIKSFKESITKDYEKQIKTLTEELNILKANGTAPTKGTELKGNIISRDDFDRMDDGSKATFFRSGGKLQD